MNFAGNQHQFLKLSIFYFTLKKINAMSKQTKGSASLSFQCLFSVDLITRWSNAPTFHSLRLKSLTKRVCPRIVKVLIFCFNKCNFPFHFLEFKFDSNFLKLKFNERILCFLINFIWTQEMSVHPNNTSFVVEVIALHIKSNIIPSIKSYGASSLF